MEKNDLLVNPDVVGSVVGAVLAFVFGILASFITQRVLDRRQRTQITFSTKTEEPLVLAKEELKEKFRVLYQGTEIKRLVYFSLKVANTGRVTIKNQSFTCLFREGTKSIDPAFPRISTVPPREVGPIDPDRSVNQENEYRYTVKTLGSGQVVSIDFLVSGDQAGAADVIFGPNEGQDVRIVQGEVSRSRSLEENLQNLVEGLLAFFATMMIFPSLGAAVFGDFGRVLGVAMGVPIFLSAYLAIKPVISAIVGRFFVQVPRDRNQITIGTVNAENLAVGNQANASLMQTQKPDADNRT